MLSLELDLFGIPWLGSVAIVVGSFLGIVVISSVIKTVQDFRAPVESAAKHRTARTKYNLHQDIHSPLGFNGRRKLFDRISPLFYEESRDGKWKISLGRVAFWLVLFGFLGMCFSVQISLNSQKHIDPSLPSIYLGVISMLFLTNLGLLGYNLGSKFTEPMTKFIMIWAQSKNSIVGSVGPTAPTVTNNIQQLMPTNDTPVAGPTTLPEAGDPAPALHDMAGAGELDEPEPAVGGVAD